MTEFNQTERLQLARLVVDVLEHWGVRAADQIILLGLPASTKPRAMRRYGEDLPLPNDPMVLTRVEHLVGIADALRTSNPRNHAADAMWLNRRNHRFANRTPLAAMLEDGLDGLAAVRAHLDCAWDWHMDAQSG